MKKKLFVILIYLLSSFVVKAADYKWVRTYDADGNVISGATYDFYIYASVSFYPSLLGGNMTILSWGTWSKHGVAWNYQPGPSCNYYGSNNGWYIFICTLGYSSYYLYYKADGSCVRETFFADGNGHYREYVLAKRPTIDRMRPTK